MPKAESSGRVQHVGTLPVKGLPEGTYELRMRLRQGEEEQLRTAYFTIGYDVVDNGHEPRANFREGATAQARCGVAGREP